MRKSIQVFLIFLSTLSIVVFAPIASAHHERTPRGTTASLAEAPNVVDMTNNIISMASGSIVSQNWDQVRELLIQRQEAIIQALHINPAIILSAGIPETTYAALPLELQLYVEQPVENITGKFRVWHGDNRDEKEANFTNLIEIGDNHIEVLGLKDTDDQQYAEKMVTISGVQFNSADDGSVIVYSNLTVQGNQENLVPQTPESTTKKVGLIIVHFQPSNVTDLTQNYSKAQLESTMYDSQPTTSFGGVRQFYELSSNAAPGGNWIISRDTNQSKSVWEVTLPYTETGCDNVMPNGKRRWETQWATDAEAAVKAQDPSANLDAFDKVIYAMDALTKPVSSANFCPGVGWAYIDGNRAWVLNYGKDFADNASHELGHTFGLEHASSCIFYDAKNEGTLVSDFCSYIEYGDPYDVMGGPDDNYGGVNGGTYDFGLFNTFSKLRLGLLSPSSVKTLAVSNQVQKVTLVAEERADAGIKSIKIPVRNTLIGNQKTYYYVELRESNPKYYLGTNNARNNGVQIRWAPDPGPLTRGGLMFTSLFPDTPGLSGTYGLFEGQTYTDPRNGLTIKVTALTNTTADLDITYTGVKQGDMNLDTGGIINSASGLQNVAPRTIATFFGSNFSTCTGLVNTTTCNVKVYVGGKEAQVSFVSPTMMNVYLPDPDRMGYSADGFKTMNVGIENKIVQGNTTVTRWDNATVSIDTLSFGLYTERAFGAGPVIAQHYDYDNDGVADYTPVSNDKPARPGEIIIFYGTGGVGTGLRSMSFDGAFRTSATVGDVSGMLGLKQLNVKIPSSLPGNKTYQIKVCDDPYRYSCTLEGITLPVGQASNLAETDATSFQVPAEKAPALTGLSAVGGEVITGTPDFSPTPVTVNIPDGWGLDVSNASVQATTTTTPTSDSGTPSSPWSVDPTPTPTPSLDSSTDGW